MSDQMFYEEARDHTRVVGELLGPGTSDATAATVMLACRLLEDLINQGDDLEIGALRIMLKAARWALDQHNSLRPLVHMMAMTVVATEIGEDLGGENRLTFPQVPADWPLGEDGPLAERCPADG